MYEQEFLFYLINFELCMLQENQCSQQQSSLFKTPAESNMKPLNEKLNLSSLFTYKGMMSNTQNYKQKILSIMQNNKRKKKSIIEDNNVNLTQPMFTIKKRKIDMSQKYLPSIPEIQPEKTIINNLDDIISYYDIPSMCSKNEEYKKSDHYTHSRENRDNTSAAVTNPLTRPHPVIKSVEDVCFNLTDDNSSIHSSEQNANKNESIREDKNFLEQASCTTTQRNSKLLTSVEKEDIPRNSNFDQSKEELPKSLKFYQGRIDNELQSSIHSIDLNDKILSKLLPKEITDPTLDSMETQSYGKNIRSFLSSFDLYNIHGQDDINMEKELNELYKESDGIGKISSKHLTLNTPCEKSEFVENYQSVSKNDKGSDKNPTRSPKSLVISKKGTGVCHAYSGDISKKNILDHLESKKDTTFGNDCIINNEQEFSCHSVSKTISANSKRILHDKINKQKLFDTPQTSPFFPNNSEESMNRELSQNRESLIDEKYLKNKIKDLKNQEFDRNSRTGNSEKSCKELNDSSIRYGKYKKTFGINNIIL